MASRNSKSKSYGLRMLWIPGRRKSHHKGRFDSTDKRLSLSGYGSKQKQSEVWSLGGSRAQNSLVHADLNSTPLLDTPASTQRSSDRATDATRQGAVDAVIQSSEPGSTVVLYSKIDETVKTTFLPFSPPPTTTPSSTETTETQTMPAQISNKANQTVDIFNGLENRFAALGKEISEDFDVYDLPSTPKDNLNLRTNLIINTSAAMVTTVTSTTTASTAVTASPSSPKSDTTPDFNKDTDNVAVLYRKKSTNRNHNNNHQQGDINSIQSISDSNFEPLKPFKPSNSDLSWIDELYTQRGMQKNGKPLNVKQHKQKNKTVVAKELDQLDGVPSKFDGTPPETLEEQDEKVVKCLYYTLMCCDCSIS